MAVIDADAHVVESERTWDFMEPSEQKYRPLLVAPRGEHGQEYWLIDGKIRGLARQVVTAQQFAELSQRAGREMGSTQETREMENVEARVHHMDELGIDQQVLYGTIFIAEVADKPEWEVPICWGFNRWMSSIWEQAPDRLPWICAAPFTSIPDALDQIRWSKERGAVGVFFRGVEGNRLIHDPYFYPIYEEMQKLNLTAGVHIANSNPWLVDLVGQRNSAGFWRFRVPSIGAFHALIMDGLPDRFPSLRFHFAEAASGWVPYVLKDVRRRLAARGRALPDNPMKAYRMYVSCESDDDLDYILDKCGDDNIVIGTDYGHNDQSTEIEALRNLETSGMVSPESYRKIVSDNPQALFAL